MGQSCLLPHWPTPHAHTHTAQLFRSNVPASSSSAREPDPLLTLLPLAPWPLASRSVPWRRRHTHPQQHTLPTTPTPIPINGHRHTPAHTGTHRHTPAHTGGCCLTHRHVAVGGEGPARGRVHRRGHRSGGVAGAACDRGSGGRAPILMSPDINWPFWPFPRHSSRGLMSGARHCWPGFGAGFVRIPMEKPPNRHVPRQRTAATRPFLSGARHYPKNKIRPLSGGGGGGGRHQRGAGSHSHHHRLLLLLLLLGLLRAGERRVDGAAALLVAGVHDSEAGEPGWVED